MRKKDLVVEILSELMKNSKISDRMLAKKLGVWQSTVSRHRKKLEREGIIQEYTLIPDFRKMGFEILLFHFLKLRADILTPNFLPQIIKYFGKFPQVILAIRVTGEWDVVAMSVHKSMSQAASMIDMFSLDWKEFIEGDLTFYAVLRDEFILKPFSLRYLAET